MDAESKTQDWISADDYGRSLAGFGVNLLVKEVPRTLAFLKAVFDLSPVHATEDFAVLRYGTHEWMLHSDASYSQNPLLSLTGDGAIRGAGIELRLYGLDPDACAAKAEAAGHMILQPPTDKPHGLREAFLVDPDGYVWVPGIGIGGEGNPK